MEDSKPPSYSCSFDQGGSREKAVGTLTLPKAPVEVDMRETGVHQAMESRRPGPKAGLGQFILLGLSKRLNLSPASSFVDGGEG